MGWGTPTTEFDTLIEVMYLHLYTLLYMVHTNFFMSHPKYCWYFLRIFTVHFILCHMLCTMLIWWVKFIMLHTMLFFKHIRVHVYTSILHVFARFPYRGLIAPHFTSQHYDQAGSPIFDKVNKVPKNETIVVLIFSYLTDHTIFTVTVIQPWTYSYTLHYIVK